nr:olfactory receptor 51H1-like [Pan troglodytes]
MTNLNASHASHRNFILTGIPGTPDKNPWLAFPLGFLYTLTLLGIGTILAVIKVEPSLHEPMYYFLSILALTDVSLSMSTLPSMLSIYWFNAPEIAFDACIMQMFFIHVFGIVESGVLVSMAFDRFVAIRNPLHYVSILNHDVIRKIGIAILTRAVCVVFPVPFLIKCLTLLPFQCLVSFILSSPKHDAASLCQHPRQQPLRPHRRHLHTGARCSPHSTVLCTHPEDCAGHCLQR